MYYIEAGRYFQSITNPVGLFRTLSLVKVVTDFRGDIDYVSGSNAVIFVVEVGDKRCLMKCYTKSLASRAKRYEMIKRRLTDAKSPYIIDFSYLPHEIYVFDAAGKGSYQDVLLMERLEGFTLSFEVARLAARYDKAALEALAEKFDKMALWLLSEDFAHGDLKYDNIIVTPSGELKLIDYDAVFTSEMQRIHSSELGTAGFQHPRRGKSFFNRHLDDYAVAIMSLSLHLVARDPSLYQIIESPIELHPLLPQFKQKFLLDGDGALYSIANFLNSSAPVLDGLSLALSSLCSATNSQGDMLETSEGITIVRSDGLYGFRNEDNIWVIEPIYDDVKMFSQGVAAVRIAKRWFFVDKRGKKVLDCAAYDQVEMFSEGFSVVKKGNNYGYINFFGDIATPLIFEYAHSFSQGVAAVKLNGKYGYIDREFRFLIEPEYDIASNFRDGKAWVLLNNQRIQINLTDYVRLHSPNNKKKSIGIHISD